MHDERSGADDLSVMHRALELARCGWGQTAPNPMVGAVIVGDDAVVGEGFHARFGEAHAEAIALAAAGPRANGATVYVTLEPCTHHGKTPPCADALIAANVARVVIAAADPNPRAAGGAARLRASGIDVTMGVEADAARELDPAFFFAFSSARPWITLKLALSLDGALSDATGASRWVTGRRARAAAHGLRAGSDAVGVGIGTVLADDPMLTVRDAPAPRVSPRRVVFDRHARTPLHAALVRSAREVPTIVIAETPDPAAARLLEAAGVTVIRAPALGPGLEMLAQTGVRSLLIEGGARLACTFWEQSLVDRLIIFQGPVVLGAGAHGAFAFVPPQAIGSASRLPVRYRKALGDDTMTVFAVHEVPALQTGSLHAND
jgi:diaminohydroxyphosphoribosylaminopyrimidine deaminase/5-amino-6-(5-phosphoribosylamino)uracil reductase